MKVVRPHLSSQMDNISVTTDSVTKWKIPLKPFGSPTEKEFHLGSKLTLTVSTRSPDLNLKTEKILVRETNNTQSISMMVLVKSYT